MLPEHLEADKTTGYTLQRAQQTGPSDLCACISIAINGSKAWIAGRSRCDIDQELQWHSRLHAANLGLSLWVLHAVALSSHMGHSWS